MNIIYIFACDFSNYEKIESNRRYFRILRISMQYTFSIKSTKSSECGFAFPSARTTQHKVYSAWAAVQLSCHLQYANWRKKAISKSDSNRTARRLVLLQTKLWWQENEVVCPLTYQSKLYHAMTTSKPIYVSYK